MSVRIAGTHTRVSQHHFGSRYRRERRRRTQRKSKCREHGHESGTTTATTDNAGAYAIPFLRPGNYKVTAAPPGSKQYTQDKLTLEAAKVTGVDIHLEVGGVNETVEVTAEAVALDTQ